MAMGDHREPISVLSSTPLLPIQPFRKSCWAHLAVPRPGVWEQDALPSQGDSHPSHSQAHLPALLLHPKLRCSGPA